MDQWGALTNATSVITRDDLSIRRKTLIVSSHSIQKKNEIPKILQLLFSIQKRIYRILRNEVNYTHSIPKSCSKCLRKQIKQIYKCVCTNKISHSLKLTTVFLRFEDWIRSSNIICRWWYKHMSESAKRQINGEYSELRITHSYYCEKLIWSKRKRRAILEYRIACEKRARRMNETENSA